MQLSPIQIGKYDNHEAFNDGIIGRRKSYSAEIQQFFNCSNEGLLYYYCKLQLFSNLMEQIQLYLIKNI